MADDSAPHPPTRPPGAEPLFEAARRGDAAGLAAQLDASPGLLQAKAEPYGWSLLHAAAHTGQVEAVDLLLARGLDPNTLEDGDRTTPMHWAAAAGHLEVVRRLIDAGGDVIGAGDDHALEVIGWATCWEGPPRAREVAELLVSRGARHHLFSAIALEREDEVRRIVREDPGALGRRMSRNEQHQQPLHFAVRRGLPRMAALLVELGADPLAVDGVGLPVAAYASSLEADRPVMTRIRELTRAELDSAARGGRPPQLTGPDLLAALALEDLTLAGRILDAEPRLAQASGALHLMAKRGAVEAVAWLLARGADPNARWGHWDAEVTPLHLAVAHGHAGVARRLLEAGADPRVRDSKHGGDARGWAEFFGQAGILAVLDQAVGPGAGQASRPVAE